MGNKKEIMSFFEEGKIIEEINEKLFITYEKIKGIFPTAQRELVLCNGEACNEINFDNPMILCRCSVDHKDYPIGKEMREKLNVRIYLL